MSAALTLATIDHRDALLRLVTDFHAEQGIESDETHRAAAIEPLLEGIPHGCAYLIGPTRAPIGYVIICFSWSIEFGGLDAMIDELFIRPPVRGRGVATEALLSLSKALASGGVKAMHLEVDRDDSKARKLYTRAGFRERDRYMLMSRVLR